MRVRFFTTVKVGIVIF